MTLFEAPSRNSGNEGNGIDQFCVLMAKLRAATNALEETVAHARALPSSVVTQGRTASTPCPSDLRTTARHYLQLRRQRDSLFSPKLFADPAWDLLLDLYAAETEGRSVSVSSACIAAAVPSTTGLRWIGTLEEHGLVVRRADIKDRRRFYLSLTPETTRSVGAWLTELRATFPR